MQSKPMLDFTQLDPLPAQLHLPIRPAQNFQFAGVGPTA